MAKRSPRQDPALERVFEIITVTALAARIGITPQSVAGWRRVPAERVFEVADITGIPVNELRPDITKAKPQVAA